MNSIDLQLSVYSLPQNAWFWLPTRTDVMLCNPRLQMHMLQWNHFAFARELKKG